MEKKIIKSDFTENYVEIDEVNNRCKKFYQFTDGFLAENNALEVLTKLGFGDGPHYSGCGDFGGKKFVEMEYLQGTGLSKPVAASEGSLADCCEFGVLVRKLHTMTIGKSEHFNKVPTRSLPVLLEQLEKLEWIDARDKHYASSQLKENSNTVFPEISGLGLLHRDLRFDNLVRTHDGTLKLFDLEVCAIGAPLGDLSRVVLQETSADSTLSHAFLEGYGITIKDYEQTNYLFDYVYAIEMLTFLASQIIEKPRENNLIKVLLKVLEQK